MRRYKAKADEKIYIFKVSLSDWEGKSRGQPYRVLAIPESFSLYRLAESIVLFFGFYFDHCFGFYDNIRNWTKSIEGYELFADIGEESEFGSVKMTKVSKVFGDVGKKMLFLFDYGDMWHFVVEFQEIEPSYKDTKYPLVIKSVGKNPTQYEYEEDEEEGGEDEV